MMDIRVCVTAIVVMLIMMCGSSGFANADGVTATYKRADKHDTACADETNQEGKFGYETTDNSVACCNITGIPPFTAKSKKTMPMAGICCIKNGTVRANNKLECCRNGKKKNAKVGGKTRSICLVRKGTFRLIADGQLCKDTSKLFHYHFEVEVKSLRTILGSGRPKNVLITGDGCCSVPTVNMIQFKGKCCSTSNSPCLNEGIKDKAPDCCGQRHCVTRTERSNNGPNGAPIEGGFVSGVCVDNVSGLWNITANLSQEYIPVSRPVVDGTNVSRCNLRKGQRGFLMGKACCANIYDRFMDSETIVNNCCTLHFNGDVCTKGVDCCSGTACERNFEIGTTGKFASGCPK